MRTVQDEKKLIGMTDEILGGLKTSRPLFIKVLDVAEQYQKQQAALAQTGMLLGELLGQTAKSQGQEDIDKGVTVIADIIRETEHTREDYAKTLMMGVLVPMRLQLEAEKKDLPNFRKESRAAQKRARQAVAKAEEATKKAAKNPSTLQSCIQSLNERIAEAQGVNVEQLRKALLLQRKKYCDLCSWWLEALKKQDEVHLPCSQKYHESEKMLTDLAGSATRMPEKEDELVKQKKRTLIDISDISNEWKQIFKAAGINKSDLQDEETAALVIKTIESLGIAMPTGGFSGAAVALDDPAEDEGDSGSSHGAPAPPPVPSRSPGGRGPPPPPPSRTASRGSVATVKSPPPPPPRGGATPTTPKTVPGRAPPPPPPPGRDAPVPPERDGAPMPPARDAPMPPPMPGGGGAPSGGGGLLSQIQARPALKKTSTEPRQPATLPDAKAFQGTDLTSILRNAMASRRTQIKKEDEPKDEDEEDGWSDGEWSD